jgi:predicted unusual protein kinase regulating ubiquinone biosynthesis (AarF/ABC1/UbiB family)
MAAMISDLVRGATKFGLEVPPDFLLVGKAIMTIEGVGKEIDPDLDVFGEAKPVLPRPASASATRPSGSATRSGAGSSGSRWRPTIFRSRSARSSRI